MSECRKTILKKAKPLPTLKQSNKQNEERKLKLSSQLPNGEVISPNGEMYQWMHPSEYTMASLIVLKCMALLYVKFSQPCLHIEIMQGQKS